MSRWVTCDTAAALIAEPDRQRRVFAAARTVDVARARISKRTDAAAAIARWATRTLPSNAHRDTDLHALAGQTIAAT